MTRIRWRQGVEGPPLDGLRWMWAAAAPGGGMGLAPRGGPAARWIVNIGGNLLTAAAFACVAVGATHWITWASDGYFSIMPEAHNGWSRAADYRRWVVPLSVPFFLAAFTESYVRIVRQRVRRSSNQAAPDEVLLGAPALGNPDAEAAACRCVFAGRDVRFGPLAAERRLFVADATAHARGQTRRPSGHPPRVHAVDPRFTAGPLGPAARRRWWV